jgi:hypothetical protein
MAPVAELNRTPDVIGALRRPAPALELVPEPLNVLELDDAITAILDREEHADADTRARLSRVRARLEGELADRLAE